LKQEQVHPGEARTTPRPNLGVVQTYATQFDGPLFRFLAERGSFDLTVFYTRQKGDALLEDGELQTEKRAWDNDVRTGYRAYVRPAGLFGGLSLVRRILSARHDLLVISGYSPRFHWVIALLARLKGMNVGLRSDSILAYGGAAGLKKVVKDITLPWMLKVYKTGHPVGSLAAEYLEHYGLPKQAIFFFPYNVDNDWLSERAKGAAAIKQELRRHYGIPPEAPTVLGILKFVPREDPITLLLGFERMRDKVPEAHLVLVGDGELRETIEDRIEKAGLRNYVHLPGYLPYSQLPPHYAMADIFVHTAVREQWGVSVNEAMVCGVPVVTSSSVGAARDLIRDGESGFVFPVGDPDALARKIEKLATSQALRRSFAEEASKTIQRWHYRETANQLELALRFVRSSRDLKKSGKAQ
jgi:glycosyltransferase involved in cell wall biosynthesis